VFSINTGRGLNSAASKMTIDHIFQLSSVKLCMHGVP